MDVAARYPKNCQGSIRRITNEIGACAETAYGMMLMTAALMDLRPEDDEVLHMILQDCGIEDGDVG